MSRTIISLTSIPPRLKGLGPVLESLLAQDADAVELWLPRDFERFPRWDGALPALPQGVTLARCSADVGPATKVLPALARLAPGDRLICCDDDMTYGAGWLAGLLAASHAEPQAAIAVSVWPVSRLALDPRPGPGHLVVQGFAGVLLRQGMLPSGCHIAPRDRFVDDIWISAQLAAAGVPILAAPGLRDLVRPLGAGVAALQDERPDGLSRAQANLRSAAALRRDLGIWD